MLPLEKDPPQLGANHHPVSSCCRWCCSKYHNGCFEAARWLGAQEATGVALDHWIGSDGELMPIGARWHWYTLICLDFFSLCGLVPLPFFLGFSENLDCHHPLCPWWFCHHFASGWMMFNYSLIDLNGTNDRWPSCWVNICEYATPIYHNIPQFWSMLYRLYHFKSRRLLPGLHALLMEDDSFGHAQLADAQLMRAVSCRIQQIVWLSGNSQQ